jgi:hypothetical protein
MVGSVNLRDCKELEKMVKKHLQKGRLYGAIGDWGMLKGFKVRIQRIKWTPVQC